jgi:DNA-binding beta-propeller fold protein YncE
VVDSRADTVWIFTIQGAYVGSIGSSGSGPGQLSFPTSIAYSPGTGELFVADQKNHRIQVFDFDGNFLRSIGSKIEEEGWFNPTLVWEGRFGKIQSVSIDASGRLHALDTFLNRIQILDPSTGAYQSSYNAGAFGSAPGELNLPLDFVFDSSGGAIITDAGNSRVQRFMVP